MRARHAAAVTLVLLGVVALAVPTVGVSVDVLQDPAQENETTAEAELGEQVSAFAQASAADSRNTVESGMWGAGLTNDSEEVAVDVETRAARLEERLNRLEKESQALAADRENLSKAAYTARASAVRAEIANVRSALEQTNETAHRHGVNSTKLEVLRSDAANLTGPEVSAVARNLTDPPRGPPIQVGPADETVRGPSDERGPGSGPSNDTGPGDDRGPPADRNQSQPDDTGPPDDGGPSDDSGASDKSRAGGSSAPGESADRPSVDSVVVLGPS